MGWKRRFTQSLGTEYVEGVVVLFSFRPSLTLVPLLFAVRMSSSLSLFSLLIIQSVQVKEAVNDNNIMTDVHTFVVSLLLTATYTYREHFISTRFTLSLPSLLSFNICFPYKCLFSSSPSGRVVLSLLSLGVSFHAVIRITFVPLFS